MPSPPPLPPDRNGKYFSIPGEQARRLEDALRNHQAQWDRMTAFSRLYDPNVFLDLLTNQEGFCEHYRTPFGVEWLIDYFRRGGLMGPGSPVLYPQAPYYREPGRHGEVVDALHKAESGRLADGLVTMDRLWNEYKMIKAALIVPDEEPSRTPRPLRH
jgi:hypothetical protein